MNEQLQTAIGLLAIAVCPNTACTDGRIVYDRQQEPCQWCAMRKEVVESSPPAHGEKS